METTFASLHPEIAAVNMKLDIGSGETPLDGYIGVDLYAKGENVVNAPMDTLPFPDESVSEVYSSHALEHVSKHDVVKVLREWRRVLAWDGKLTIEVPDLVWVCKNWLLYQDNGWNMDAIFGDQSNDGQYHKTGFTRPIMYEYLTKAGFVGRYVTTSEVFSHNQNCIIFEVCK